MSVRHSTLFHLFAQNNIHSTERAQISSLQTSTWLKAILCWVLMFRRDRSWVLHYVQSAHTVTDTPDQVGSGALCGCISADGTLSRVWVPELVSQWRRWLNGSFFVAIHGTVKLHYIYRSSHSFKPKSWIHVELTYQTFNLVCSWFTLGTVSSHALC
ncbi:hypothetical protein EDB83DRAFT_85318 [Lactarius deliciosus]|nr:hypothetical protein EDB83DRAFT_85318 [Lactarius deliciosus]